MDRRDFLLGSMGAAILASWPADSFGQARAPSSTCDLGLGPAAASPADGQRHADADQGVVRAPLTAPPTLRVGTTTVRGRMNDTAGECWQFYAAGLAPGAPLPALAHRRQRHVALPAVGALDVPVARRQPRALPRAVLHLRRRTTSAPAGYGQPSGNLPTALRNRLLRRGLSFQPDAAVANGDHVYWDLHAPRTPARPSAEHDAARQLQSIGARLRRQERDRAQARGRPADRSGVRHRLPFDAGVLPAGRSRLLRQRRRDRRDRHVPAVLVSAPARARDAADVLPGVSARRARPREPPVVVGGHRRPRCRRASARCGSDASPRFCCTTSGAR